MKNRKPFELKNTLIVYNAIQVVFSVILVVEVCKLIFNKISYIILARAILYIVYIIYF